MLMVIKKLGDACEVEYGTRVVQQKDGGTIFPVYGGGGATFNMDVFNREDCFVIARFAMSKQCTRFIKGKFFLNDSGLSVKPKNDNELNQEYLNYQLRYLNDNIYSLSRGTAQRNLNVPKFRNLEISYPKSLSDQIQIANVLSKAETLIEQRKQSIALLDDFLKSTFLEMFGDPGFNKKQWEKFQLQDLIAKGDKINYGVVQPGEDGNKTGIEIIRVGDFEGIKINSKNLKLIDAAVEQKHKASRLIGDEVLLACVGATIGKIALVDNSHKGYNIVRAVARVRCNFEKLNRLYLCQLLLTSYYQFNILKI